jgi:hypothetical protein
MALGLKESVTKAITDHNITDKVISKFLYLIADNTLNDKSERDAKNESIRALFREGFIVSNPSGTKKIGSKVIQQCLWRLMSKIKFLDFDIHATGKDDSTEQLTTEGLATVMDRGNLSSCFRDKGGVFQNAAMYGDGFLFFGKGKNDENPISYRVLRNEDVYVDSFAYGVRGVRPASRMVVIYAFDKDEAYAMYPELEENGVFGKIPGTYQDSERDMDRKNEDVVEIAWGYDIHNKTHTVFAGVQAYELERYTDEEYPFNKNKKPYIPVFQFLCQPSEDGFWNYGIGDMVFDLAVITRRLLNMEVGHIEENVHPITLINAPQSKVDELVEKMAMANKARANGVKPFVGMEFSSQGAQGVSAQSLLTQNLASEWQMVWDRLYKEIARLGISLDDVDRGSGFTATQIYAEEQTQNAFVQQMMEYNATETKELIECSLDGVTEFVSNSNKTELNLKTRIKLPDNSTMKLDEKVTMGMLSKELKSSNYFVEVNARTGVAQSFLMRITKLKEQLAMTPPGTPEYSELYRRSGELLGIDIELAPPAPMPEVPAQGAAPTAGAPAEGGVPPTPQQPTPQTINPELMAQAMSAQ